MCKWFHSEVQSGGLQRTKSTPTLLRMRLADYLTTMSITPPRPIEQRMEMNPRTIIKGQKMKGEVSQERTLSAAKNARTRYIHQGTDVDCTL